MSSELKPCPFCGSEVYLERKPMWNGSHGYHGCYEYLIKCHNNDCGCIINLAKNNTIYYSDEEARNNTIDAWNTRAEVKS